jgi:hypothetical protein
MQGVASPKMNETREQLDQERAALEEKVAQLEQALQSRIRLEQAKGVLMERLQVDADGAFALLRYSARTARKSLHELASEVIASRQNPPAIIVGLARSQRWLAASQREQAEALREQAQLQAGRARRLAERQVKPRLSDSPDL